jgi:hypothetical protein
VVFVYNIENVAGWELGLAVDITSQVDVIPCI